MDISTITGLIGSLGFPIVAFILMYKMSTDSLDKIEKSLSKLYTAISLLTQRIEYVEKISNSQTNTKGEKNED